MVRAVLPMVGRAKAVVIGAHAGLLSTLALLRWSSCHNETFDLALYARTAWGLTAANPWNPIVDTTFLHLHSAWILFPLGWLGRLTSTVPVLLIAQSLVVAACAWPLARIGERHLGPRGGAFAMLLWIAYPNTGHVATFEMHPGTLALLPMCLALDALDRGDGRALWLSCVGVLSCRADYALLTCMIGLLAWRWPSPGATASQRALGLRIALASAVYLATVLSLQLAFPTHGDTSARLHFGPWGGGPWGIAIALVRDPTRVMAHFAEPERLTYAMRLLLPLALLPLASARWLWIALPTIAINLCSVWPGVTRLDSHYLTPAVPSLVVAAITGTARVRPRFRHVPSFAVLSAVIASALMGGLPWSRDMPWPAFTHDARSDACTAIVALVPPDASVQAPDWLLPHLAERKTINRAPPPERLTDYVVLDVRHRLRFAHRETLLRTAEEPLVRTWIARADHAVIHAQADMVLLQRGVDPRATLVGRYRDDSARPALSARKLTQCLSVTHASHDSGTVRLHLVAHGPCPSDLALRLGSVPLSHHVDLPFDGLLSPVHLRDGDRLVSVHRLTETEAATVARTGLWVGAVRQSGARPHPSDPRALPVPLLP